MHVIAPDSADALLFDLGGVVIEGSLQGIVIS